jgi:hypothetical protein
MSKALFGQYFPSGILLPRFIHPIPAKVSLARSSTQCTLPSLRLVLDAHFSPSCLVRFCETRKVPFVLPFQHYSTVLDAKRAMAPRLHCAPEQICLSVRGAPLPNDALILRIARQLPRLLSIQVSVAEPSENETVVMFEHELVRLKLGEGAVAGDAIAALREKARPGTSAIKLSFNGKPLDAGQAIPDCEDGCLTAESTLLQARPRMFTRPPRVILKDGVQMGAMEDPAQLKIASEEAVLRGTVSEPMGMRKWPPPRSYFFTMGNRTLQREFDSRVTAGGAKMNIAFELGVDAGQISFVANGKIVEDGGFLEELMSSQISVNVISPEAALVAATWARKAGKADGPTRPQGMAWPENGLLAELQGRVIGQLTAEELAAVRRAKPGDMDDVASALVYMQCGRDLETAKRNFA